MHGYGEYCGRYAFFAKAFAEAGYDFAGIDWRNFGHSVTDPKYMGLLESWESNVDDQINFIHMYDQKYGGKDVPKYIIGHS